jgi:hypothetical protein
MAGAWPGTEDSAKTTVLACFPAAAADPNPNRPAAGTNGKFAVAEWRDFGIQSAAGTRRSQAERCRFLETAPGMC